MRRGRLLAAVAVLAFFPVVLACAGGGGGLGISGQYFGSTGLNGPLMGVSTVSGFGYGVNADGDRVGAFGMAFFSPTATLEGGAGGLVVGHEWWLGPVSLAINLWGGVGGEKAGSLGYMLVVGQGDVEIGLAWLPWMQIVFYVGYQTWGNLFPGVPFASAVSAAPILGFRVAWGGR
jgi:hypothetical protein